MRIVQFTRFSVPEGSEQSMVTVRAASVQSWRRTHPQLRDVLLVRLEGREWLDVALWETDALRCEPGELDALPPPEARADFFARVDQVLGEECGLLVTHSATGAGDETHLD